MCVCVCSIAGGDLEHVGGLPPPLRDVLGLVEQTLGLVRLVQVSDQLRLEVVLHVVHEEVHHSLRNRVLDGLTDDVEVRLDQTLWKYIHSFMNGERYEGTVRAMT